MADLFVLCIVAVFFFVTMLLVRLCDQLMGGQS